MFTRQEVMERLKNIAEKYHLALLVYERMVSKGIITYYCSPFLEEEDRDEDH